LPRLTPITQKGHRQIGRIHPTAPFWTRVVALLADGHSPVDAPESPGGAGVGVGLPSVGDVGLFGDEVGGSVGGLVGGSVGGDVGGSVGGDVGGSVGGLVGGDVGWVGGGCVGRVAGGGPVGRVRAGWTGEVHHHDDVTTGGGLAPGRDPARAGLSCRTGATVMGRVE